MGAVWIVASLCGGGGVSAAFLPERGSRADWGGRATGVVVPGWGGVWLRGQAGRV